MFQLLGASCTSIYSECKAGRGLSQRLSAVLPKAIRQKQLGKHLGLKPWGSWSKHPSLQAQLSLWMSEIAEHPLLAGQGLGHRELPVAFGILLLVLLLSLLLLAGERERKESGIVWVTAALTQLFTFKVLIKNIKGISSYT